MSVELAKERGSIPHLMALLFHKGNFNLIYGMSFPLLLIRKRSPKEKVYRL